MDHAFEPDAARRALRDILTNVGLTEESASLLRLGSNAMFHLPSANVVVRLAPRMTPEIEKEVLVARWLERSDFPAVRLANLPQMVRSSDGRIATFWQFVRSTGQPTLDMVGALIRQLHELPAPGPDDVVLPAYDPLARLGPRIDRLVDVDPADKETLHNLFKAIEPKYRSINWTLNRGHIHGDAHSGNLVLSSHGPILLDLERFSYGPREWDLTVVATHVDFGWLTPEEYQSFVQAYGGFDVREWPNYPTLLTIRQLTMTSWLGQLAGQSATLREEFSVRMAALRGTAPITAWQPV